MQNPVWTLVLAAGAGRRLASVTGGVPKQFWSPDGGPSLLDATLERTSFASPSQQTVVVIDWSHAAYVRGARQRGAADHWIAQPSDRGTAAGVLLGLDYISRQSRDAIVLLTPSDHGLARADVFERGLRRAIRSIRSNRGDIVLFGVAPDRAHADYGWIVPAHRTRERLAPVTGFVEKPTAAQANSLFTQGAVWNTMILVGRVTTLLGLYRRHLPQLVDAMLDSGVRRRIHDVADLEATYAKLPEADFSRDLLARAAGLAVYTWPSDIGWSDLGTPARLAAWRREHQSFQRPAGRRDPAGPVAIAS